MGVHVVEGGGEQRGGRDGWDRRQRYGHSHAQLLVHIHHGRGAGASKGGGAVVRARPRQRHAHLERALGRRGGLLALVHGESRDDPDAFESVLTFEPVGEETRIVMRAVFPTKELRDEAVEKYHAIEGGEQTLGNLAAYVTEMARKGVGD